MTFYGPRAAFWPVASPSVYAWGRAWRPCPTAISVSGIHPNTHTHIRTHCLAIDQANLKGQQSNNLIIVVCVFKWEVREVIEAANMFDCINQLMMSCWHLLHSKTFHFFTHFWASAWSQMHEQHNHRQQKCPHEPLTHSCFCAERQQSSCFPSLWVSSSSPRLCHAAKSGYVQTNQGIGPDWAFCSL